MAVVVSDTSPVVALAQLRHLDWLDRFFNQVLIPPAVVAELQKPAWQNIARDVLSASYVQVQAPTDRARISLLLRTLDPGEAEALALAIEVQAKAVLIDEALGRETARQLGLTTVGVLGLLLRAKREGLVSALRPDLDLLQHRLGFHLSDHLRAQVLPTRASESRGPPRHPINTGPCLFDKTT